MLQLKKKTVFFGTKNDREPGFNMDIYIYIHKNMMYIHIIIALEKNHHGKEVNQIS